MRTLSSQLKETVGKNVIVAGWVHDKRDLGGIKFLILRDRDGFLQITAPKKKVSEKIFEIFNEIGLEYVIQVKGIAVESRQLASGVEVIPERIDILCSAESPLPLDPTEKVPADFETRFNHRTIDLRIPKNRAIFKIQECLVEGFREFLFSNHFTEIHTPKIVATGTEGGTELFPVQYFEKKAFLAQSPQFYKQMLVGAGFERVFEVGFVYRAEEHNTVRHINEYLSLDVEYAFIESDEDLRKFENEMFLFIYEKLGQERREELSLLGCECPVVPHSIPALTFSEALEIVGSHGKDISPEDERNLSEYAREKHDSEFLFLTHYPPEKRPMYAMPDGQLTKTFDLLFRGTEVTTGGQRMHEYQMLKNSIASRGLNPDDFSFYLEVFKYGMPPHGGFAIGAERLTVQTLNLKNIREASFFPRDRTRLTP
jgi:nondiscriminating aspartyl-tRNA synthetase